MLFNPKWNDTQPSLAGFIAWLERQPADGEYDYKSCEVCAVARYAWEMGSSYHGMDRAVRSHLEAAAVATPWTFGAAAERARALFRV